MMKQKTAALAISAHTMSAGAAAVPARMTLASPALSSPAYASPAFTTPAFASPTTKARTAARPLSKPVVSSETLRSVHSPARVKAHAEAAKLARRDRVVLEHLPLVKAIAVRVHENLPVHVELDDLVHAGILGLFDAATKFNPEKQVAFSSYAKHRIKGAILDSLRQLD